MKRRSGFNTKRRIKQDLKTDYLEELARLVHYGGNPEHKRNPGDFGLSPPSQPRPDKTLCDEVKIFSRAKATELLKAGVRKGLISEQERNGYPQNIWVVTEDGYPLEAELENSEQGIYHGYPMPKTDPFRKEVVECWNQR